MNVCVVAPCVSAAAGWKEQLQVKLADGGNKKKVSKPWVDRGDTAVVLVLLSHSCHLPPPPLIIHARSRTFRGSPPTHHLHGGDFNFSTTKFRHIVKSLKIVSRSFKDYTIENLRKWKMIQTYHKNDRNFSYFVFIVLKWVNELDPGNRVLQNLKTEPGWCRANNHYLSISTHLCDRTILILMTCCCPFIVFSTLHENLLCQFIWYGYRDFAMTLRSWLSSTESQCARVCLL